MKTTNGGNNLQKTDIWMQERIKQKHRQKGLVEASNKTSEKTIKARTTSTELILREIEYNFFKFFLYDWSHLKMGLNLSQ